MTTVAVSCEDLEIYALDALSLEEMEAFDAHLLTCDACAQALPSLHEASAVLALSLPVVRPPARLKMNILGLTATEDELAVPSTSVDDNVVSIGKRKKAFRVALAVSSIAASFALGTALTLQYSDGDSSSNVVQAEIAPASTVLDQVKASPDSSIINKKLSTGGEVNIAYSRSINKAVFSSDNLSSLDPSKVYQVWFQNRAGKMIPVGAVTNDHDNLMVLDGDVKDAVALGITVEDGPGATVPTTDPITLVNL